jgi:hypothetical protein
MILDNQWLGTLLETGLVGVLAWIWLFRRFLKKVNAEARRDQSDRGWLLTALSASVLAYALAMLTYDAWSFIQVTWLLFILLGIGSVVLQQEDLAPAPAPEPLPKPQAETAPSPFVPPARRRRRKFRPQLPGIALAVAVVFSVRAARGRAS